MGETFRQFLRDPTDICAVCKRKTNTMLLVVSDTKSLELCPEHFTKAMEELAEQER